MEPAGKKKDAYLIDASVFYAGYARK